MNLLHSLLALWPSDLAFTVTLMFIGQVWANHHVMFDHIRQPTGPSLLLNALLLMVVAFLPFATPVLVEAVRSGHGQRTAAACASPRSGGRVAAHRPVEDGGLRSHER